MTNELLQEIVNTRFPWAGLDIEGIKEMARELLAAHAELERYQCASWKHQGATHHRAINPPEALK
jgi:hypothetical protein